MRCLKFIISLIIVSFSIVIYDSCSGNKQPQGNNEPMFSSADTSLVSQLTEQFMSELQSGNFDAAFSRLYDIGPDHLNNISEDERKELKEYFSAFPVLRYNLKSTEWRNVYEVRYHYSFEFFEKPEGEEAIPNTMNLTLNPVKLNDEWFLTLQNKSVNK